MYFRKLALMIIPIIIGVASVVFSATPATTNKAKKNTPQQEVRAVRQNIAHFVRNQEVDDRKYMIRLKSSKISEKEKSIQSLDYRINKLNARIKYMREQKAKLQNLP